MRGNLKNKRETHTELAAELLQKSRPAFTIDRGRQIGLGDGFAVGPRAFRIALIKPSHYDEDGYVIQWRRSYIPSNSLASVYALIKDCAQTNALGPDVAIEIEACDECNSFVNVRAIARRIRAAGGGMVGLVGVQSNQFPRALDLGRQFRALGIPVVMGGFHVSGCLAMLPGIPPEMQEALDLGIHLFAG